LKRAAFPMRPFASTKLLKTRMTAFAADKGLTLLADFDVDTLSRFRSTWKDGPRTAGKTLERLRSFFRFAHDRSWTENNPATRLKLPRVSLRPTMPLTQADMLKLLAACEASLRKSKKRTAKASALRLMGLCINNATD
jgi:site-specific recombinase XerD